MTTRKKTSFACIEMQDKAAVRIHDELEGMSKEEQLAYWRRISEAARAEFPEFRAATSPSSRTE